MTSPSQARLLGSALLATGIGAVALVAMAVALNPPHREFLWTNPEALAFAVAALAFVYTYYFVRAPTVVRRTAERWLAIGLAIGVFLGVWLTPAFDGSVVWGLVTFGAFWAGFKLLRGSPMLAPRETGAHAQS